MNIKGLLTKFDRGSIIEYFILGILGLVVNYANQYFTWNYENKFTATTSFIAFFFIYLFIIIVASKRIIRTPEVSSFYKIFPLKRYRSKIKHINSKTLYKALSFIALLTLLIFGFILNLFNVFNYYAILNELNARQNRIQTFPTKMYSSHTEQDNRFIIVNSLVVDPVDDETLVFAKNLNRELEIEKEKYKLPLTILQKEIDKSEIDSLIKIYEGVYIITGNYYNRDAEISIRKYHKKFQMKTTDLIFMLKSSRDGSFPKMDNVNFDTLYNYDSQPTAIFYDSDNSILDKYKVKIGVPSEIKFLIYRTFGDLVIQNPIPKSSYLSDSLTAESKFEQMIDYAIQIYSLAEKNAPKQINYFGFKPVLRKDTNINSIHEILCAFYGAKARLLLEKGVNKDHKYSELKIDHGINEYFNFLYYLNKIQLSPKKIENFSNEGILNYSARNLFEIKLHALYAEARYSKIYRSFERYLGEYEFYASQPDSLTKRETFFRSLDDKPILTKEKVREWKNTQKKLIRICKAIINDHQESHDRLKKLKENLNDIQNNEFVHFILVYIEREMDNIHLMNNVENRFLNILKDELDVLNELKKTL
ncbi:MAG: hypothetical protein ACK4TA_15895 [Saprospiraceae bacterium]